MYYFVIELQTATEGSAIVTAFPTKEDALEKFYDTAKYAVKSGLPYHSVMCVNSRGFDIIDPITYSKDPE